MMTKEFNDNKSKLLKGTINIENKQLFDTLPLAKHKVVVYDKEHLTPRDVGFFSDFSSGYKYSGNILQAIKFHDYPFLLEILNNVNTLTNSNFNSILVNRYANGDDYIGAHSDNEKSLSTTGIVTISIGQERIFRIRDKKTKKIVKDIIVKDSDLYWMTGEFQKHYTHEIPKQKSAKGVRISLTFRKHLV